MTEFNKPDLKKVVATKAQEELTAAKFRKIPPILDDSWFTRPHTPKDFLKVVLKIHPELAQELRQAKVLDQLELAFDKINVNVKAIR